MYPKSPIPVEYMEKPASQSDIQVADHKKSLNEAFHPEIDQKAEENAPKAQIVVPDTTEVPLNISLLLELRRVRQTILPAYFSQYYVNESQNPNNELFNSIAIIQGTLSAAETAMMNQDFFGMLAAHHQLKSFQLALESRDTEAPGWKEPPDE